MLGIGCAGNLAAPDTGYTASTIRTKSVLGNAVPANAITVSLNQQRAAIGAARILIVSNLARQIARINVPQARLTPDAGCPQQRVSPGVLRTGHLVVLVKRRDVPWDIR